MNLLIIKPDSITWTKIWEQLAEHPINDGLSEPMVAENDGEKWQYLGTAEKNGIIINDYRHRNHPYDNQPKYISLRYEATITDDDIASKLPIK